MKLMKRDVPLKLLDTFVFWLQNFWSCVKWKSVFSQFFKLDYGVRQGCVLLPHLFAIYVDDITNCLSFGQKPLIIMYADDIILVAPYVCVLQKLLDKCEQELNWLGMTINVKESCCMRVDPRCDAVCANITTSGGRQLPWVKEIRYLSIHIAHSRYLKASCTSIRNRFYRAMRCINAVFAVMQCLSVCPSRSWITSKRIKISSKFFHHVAAKSF